MPVRQVSVKQTWRPALRAPTHRQLVVLLGALSAFGPLSMDLYLPGLPSMARDLSAPAWAAQLSITTCMVGLAGGQLLAGPVSDALGRRRPLLAGLVCFATASALCALSPSIWWLLVLRLLQGTAGGAGIVIARAIVRDLHEGVEAARFFALLMMVGGLTPVLAPLVGGQLLHVTDWRGIFLVLCAIGAALLAAAARLLAETLEPERRHGGGIAATVGVFRGLLRERAFMGYVLSAGLAFSAMVAYIAGSPFVLQDIYGLSPQLFSVVFAVNAGGIIALSQVGRRIVDRVGPRALLGVGVHANAVGGAGVVAAVALHAGLGGLLPALFVVVSSVGLVLPNATALALHDHPRTAGSASALIGLVQFGCGAAVAPLVGVAGSHTAVPMAVTIVVLGMSAVIALRALARQSAP